MRLEDVWHQQEYRIKAGSPPVGEGLELQQWFEGPHWNVVDAQTGDKSGADSG